MKRIERRRFLQVGVGAGAAAAGGYALVALTGGRGRPHAAPVVAPGAAGPTDARRLVVLEMAGGNDGLSMVVPYADDRYSKLRSRTAVDANSVLHIDERVGFHPELAHLASRGAAVVAGVGIAKPDLSHFEMLRRWWTADPDGTDNPATGFLGRLCDAIGSPDTPAVGVSLGGAPTLALNADRVVTLALDPGGDGAFPSPGDGDGLDSAWRNSQRAFAHAQTGDGPLLTAARHGSEVAMRFSDVAHQLPKAGSGYPDTDLGRQLRLAARLLAADVGIRIVHVPYQSDFDTHENHTDRYTKLMHDLDAALEAFLGDLEQRKLTNLVLVATTSEFGRRVPDNDSSGLDHGAASTALLVGPVVPGVHSELPSLEHLDENDNLIATVNMTEYYATLAQHWFGVPASSVLPGSPHPLDGVIAA
jgi:uncharacterized protein (DUF1501 family)